MKRTIWKYQWPLRELVVRNVFIMPLSAKVLCAREQYDDDLCLWALVDPGAEQEPRRFQICGTGIELIESSNYDLVYVGTGHLRGGSLVLHVFEERWVAP